jgi:hypothetical protein
MSGSVRDVTSNRALLNGGTLPLSTGIQVVGIDADQATFTPVIGAIHTVAVAAAGRQWTMTAASAQAVYDLKVGEGFLFIVQNNGANTITLAAGAGVTAGAGTLTVLSARTRIFAFTRTGNATYQLDTLGVLTQ